MFNLEAFCIETNCHQNVKFASWNFSKANGLDGEYLNSKCNATSSWFGITCVEFNYHPDQVSRFHVTGLNLSHTNLSGELSEQISKLTYLKVIDLGGNSIAGTIPDNWRYLRNLEYIDLQKNALSGIEVEDTRENYAQVKTAYSNTRLGDDVMEERGR